MTDTEFLQLLEDMASGEQSSDDHFIKQANLLEQHIKEEHLMHSYELDEMADAGSNRMPAYLKEQILTRVAQPDMQMAATPRRFSKRMEFFLYSCRVTVAVAASLLLLFAASFSQSVVTPEPKADTQAQLDITNVITEHFSNNSVTLTGWFQNISKQIMTIGSKTPQKNESSSPRDSSTKDTSDPSHQ